MLHRCEGFKVSQRKHTVIVTLSQLANVFKILTDRIIWIIHLEERRK